MGSLIYSQAGVEVTFDDRALAHLQIVMAAKLRRQEGFFFSWRAEDTQRRSIWIHPAIPIQFVIDEAKVEINRAWLEKLSLSANSPQGLQLTDEPSE